MSAITVASTIAEPFEGFRSHPYLCPAGIPTIGFGTTRYPDGRRVTLKDPPITIDQAREYLRHEMVQCIAGALRYCPGLAANEKALGAIADFCYNLGTGRLQASTLRRRINQQDWPAARKELMKWVRGGGRVLSGLVRRRKVECAYLP